MLVFLHYTLFAAVSALGFRPLQATPFLSSAILSASSFTVLLLSLSLLLLSLSLRFCVFDGLGASRTQGGGRQVGWLGPHVREKAGPRQESNIIEAAGVFAGPSWR